jgi:DNA helicase IV
MGADQLDQDAEQRWLDTAHEHLRAMQDRAAEVRSIGARAARDEDSVDARVALFHLERREAALREGAGPLCFGRIDTDNDDRWYIGRRHVEDAQARPLVVDWRAPVAAPFYRATAVDPCGLTFRRRFIVDGRRIEAMLDEDLTDPDAGGRGGLPDPLLAELERSRSGQMTDIVATIAAEQDLIIRAPLDELVVVQGGPGTGKTAVGLHRAAFLLFEHRLALLESKVLVVGPNPLFLRYIADVLPSLGETAVVQATLTGLVSARYRVDGDDDDEVARLKGRIGWAAVIRNAVRASIRAQEVELRAGLARVHLDADEVEQLQKTVLARKLPLNQGRDVFRQLVIQHAWRKHSQRPGVDPAGEPLFSSTVRADKGFKATIDKMWPTVSPAKVLQGMYRSPKKLAEAADGTLTRDEQRLIRASAAGRARSRPAPAASGGRTRSSGRSRPTEIWAPADVPLLDEAQWLCTGVPATYGHVVVDEAQDLSPMALRMLARRADAGSMTVLGDQAQATSPQAAGSWSNALNVLTDQLTELSSSSPPVTVRQTELTVGYRVPAAILDVANRLLAEAAPDVTPARSVRPGGDPPLILEVGEDEVEATVVAEVEALRQRTASVAVVAIEDRLDLLVAVLEDAGIPADRVGGEGLPGQEAVALVGPATVKGLEFDAVVVVEPAEISAGDAGLRHLYVAMTRAVQHLGLIHARPLPPLLAG